MNWVLEFETPNLGEKQMKRLICLLLLSSLMANEYPKAIKRFELSYEDIEPHILSVSKLGRITLEFFINENGDVEEPVIKDSFNVRLNQVVIDKVKQTKYIPALQNGRPIRVKYHLPIVFKWEI